MQKPGFIYGFATASYQIEGASAERLPCIWDTFCERPTAIRDGSNGEIACDHVNRWQEDVDLLSSLGADAYRLSISWPRVLTADGAPNQRGLDFYIQLLDRLNQKDIKPFVTLYHWDLPQFLENAGGWPSRDTAYRYRDYVDVVTRAFGDRVFSYATLNEPFCSAFLGYEIGIHAPGVADKTLGKKAGHNLLLAHGLGMQVLEANSPDSQNGIVLNFTPSYAATDSAEDKVAAERADIIHNQWYARPVLDGAYPDMIDDLPEDERPEIHAGDMDLISQPIDYLGVNYYTRAFYRADDNEAFVQVPPTDNAVTELGWEIYPQGLTDLLVSLDNNYELPPIYIAENGAAMADKFVEGQVNDYDRIEYLQSHLGAVNKAIEQGIDVAGYFCWSLMDNFEWAEGYSKRFGLVHVDYETQCRTIKASGYAYRDLLRNRKHRQSPTA